MIITRRPGESRQQQNQRAALALLSVATDGVEPVTDANQTLAAARQLTAVETRLFESPEPPLGSERVIPRNFSAGAWARETSFKTYTKFGRMKPVAGLAEDYPEVGVAGDETVNPVAEYGASYGFGRKELIYAARLGVALDDFKARAAQRAYEELVDELAWLGDPGRKVKGLKSYLGDGTNSTVKAVTSTTKLSAMSDAEVLTFLKRGAKSIADRTSNGREADTLVMPSRMRDYLIDRPYGTGNGDLTIMRYFLANNPYIKNVLIWNRLRGGGDAIKTFGNADVMISCRVSDLILRQQIPEPFMVLDPEMQATRMMYHCAASIGSVEVMDPGAAEVDFAVTE